MELYVLNMHDFDIILGMGWLSKNHATIHCFENEVVFKKSRGEEFQLAMIKSKSLPYVVSTLQARRIIQLGCSIAFLMSKI